MEEEVQGQIGFLARLDHGRADAPHVAYGYGYTHELQT